MASDSLATDVKYQSRLPHYAGRDRKLWSRPENKPLFTSMRQSNFQQDFTTESLNNTAIASPSPARPTYGVHRYARGGGLSAAFRRVDNQSRNEDNDEHIHNCPSHSPRASTGKPIRPGLTRHSVSEIPKPVTRVISPRGGTRTPSPRGRTLDLLSPASAISESSPPREFAEAYRQINDAEDLTAEDQELDTTDETDKLLATGGLQPGRHPSRRSSRQRSPREDDAIVLESIEPPQPETTQNSQPSLPSDLELEAVSQAVAYPSKRENDLRRLEAAIGETKAFSKARRRPRLGVEGLQRDGASSRSGSQSDHSHSSGSILSDGSLNIPQGWGRKARQGRTWLSRVARDNGNDEKRSKEAEPKIKAQEIRDWQAEASMTPLPEILEHDSLEHSPSPAPNKLSSLTSRDRVRMLAFGETEQQRSTDIFATESKFTTAIDGPSVPKANEIVNLKPRPTQITPLFGNDQEVKTKVTYEDNSNERKTDFIPDTRQLLRDLSKVASPSPDVSAQVDLRKLPNNVLDTTHTKPEPRTVKTNASVALPNMQTPAQERPQTYAKTPLVTGAWIDTPLPTTKVEPSVELETEAEGKDSIGVTLNKLGLEKLANSLPSVQEAEVEKETLLETAPKLPKSALAAIINQAKDKKAQGNAGQAEDTLNLDDSTILSLEGFLANNEDTEYASNEDSGVSSDSEVEDVKARHTEQKTVARRHRIPRKGIQISDSEEEIDILAGMDRIRISQHDQKLGLASVIASLQKQTNKTGASRSRSASRARSECEEAGEFHDFIWPCEKCGHRTGSAVWSSDGGSLLEWHWRPLQIYMPQLWYWPAGANIPRLTRLGLFTLLCSVLVVTELILCDIYSPPFYAKRMVGFGVDIDAPRPPFILAQLFWRHVIGNPLDSCYNIVQFVLHFLASLFGIFTGGSSSPGDVLESAASKARWSFQPAVLGKTQLEAMGMDVDEVL